MFGKIDQAILHKLLLYPSLLPDIGLLRGKMGISFFFMHYSRQTGEVLYEDIAGELLEEITEKLNKEMPITFESGLTGIGWAIDYLIAKGYVEGDSMDICEEIDSKIMEISPNRLTDYSLEKGISGILLYVLSHCKVVYSQQKKLPFDSVYLYDLYTACDKISSQRQAPPDVIRLSNTYLTFYKDKQLPDDNIWDVSIVVEGIPDFDERKFFGYPLGIKKGLAGILFEKYCLPVISLP